MFRQILLKVFIKFAKTIGKIHIEPKKRKLDDMNKYHIISQILRKGDIVLTRKRGELSNLFIPGYYKHSAIYCGNCEIIEAIGLGVRKIGLFDFMKDKDYICILRAVYHADESYISRYIQDINDDFIKIANKCIGKNYDYYFNPSEKEFYCSELIAYCYNETIKKDSANPKFFTVRHAFGIKTIFPQDFFDDKKRFLCFYES
jgi:uncharacterized protein YycO